MIGLHHSSIDVAKENYEFLLDHGVTKAEIEDVQAILDQAMKKLDALKSR